MNRRRHTIGSLVLLLLLGCAWGGEAGGAQKHKLIKVVTSKDGNLTRFFVENMEAGEVTATFTLAADNLEGSVDFPFTATYPPGQLTEAFSLSPIDLKKEWGYSYTNNFTIGCHVAVHDDSYVYLLPCEPGASARVTQGYNGSYSHSGPDQYAIDFKMGLGTPVHAARDGVVVKAKDDSDAGGPNRKYETCANYILIQHPDRTMSNYAHLQKGGSRVRAGEKVKAGDLIGLSGNTGFTSGPHLHFSVFKTRADGGGRESIPVKFKTSDSEGLTLVEGHTYKTFVPGAHLDRTHLTLLSPKEKEGHKPQPVGAPPRD